MKSFARCLEWLATCRPVVVCDTNGSAGCQCFSLGVYTYNSPDVACCVARGFAIVIAGIVREHLPEVKVPGNWDLLAVMLRIQLLCSLVSLLS